MALGRLQDQERQLLVQTLKQVDWNKYRAAKVLGIARSTLYSKMKKLGVKPPAQGLAKRLLPRQRCGRPTI